MSSHRTTTPTVIVYGAASITCVVIGVATGGVAPATILVVCGMLFWTLAEYVIHRWFFHGERWLRAHRHSWVEDHVMHHHEPRDPDFVTSPLRSSILIVGALVVSSVLLGGTSITAFMAGFIGGYAVYLQIHHDLHGRKPSSKLGRFLHWYHAHHHYVDEHVAFGVTTPLWDVILNTYPRHAGHR